LRGWQKELLRWRSVGIQASIAVPITKARPTMSQIRTKACAHRVFLPYNFGFRV
jgi:hypothetical protein